MPHRRFRLKDLRDLKAELAELGVEIPLDMDLSVLGAPIEIAGRELPNRFAVHPMEGFDSNAAGAPGELSFRRYGRYAAGGSGLIWFEATAVVREGRSNPGQFWINRDNAGVFADLVEHTRQTARDRNGHEVLLILQMTHSGRYSKPTGVPEPMIAHRSPILDPLHGLSGDYPLVTDDYLDALQERYVQAAQLAAGAGFDGVDIKSCHRYLVSELLASFERRGKYGGSFNNRTRMLLETAARIRERVDGIFVTTRMNVYDAIEYPYGFGVDKNDVKVPDLDEPIELAGILKEAGAPVLNVTIGNPYYQPQYGRPFDFPIKGLDVPDEHPLRSVARFLGVTRRIQEAHPDLPVIGSGYTWLRHLMPYAAAAVVRTGGATLIGQGRGAFAYPESVNDILKKDGMDPAKACVTCSACTQIMRDGGRTGCVVRDSEIYGPEYRLARRYSLDRLKDEAARCRDCLFATCTRGCPAGVDVPKFIKAFLNDDIDLAYRTLKESNVLPEMCAYVCPAEEQCEGKCLETIFCGNSVAVRDIQLFVSRAARLKGITGVRIPEKVSERIVSIVGGGPAGVACAVALLERGLVVTLYEAGDALGGTPRDLVPDCRMGIEEAGAEIEAVLRPAVDAGRLEVRYRFRLGSSVSLDDLRKESDTVVIATGLSDSVSLGSADGVVDALAFLAEVKNGRVAGIEGRVAVLGGGNTAMDAASAVVELGARDVYVVYRRSFVQMPAWKEEVDRYIRSGGHILALTQPVGYVTNQSGELTGLRIARTELGDPDDSGRRRPEIVPDSESVLSVDMVIEAVGQTLSGEVAMELKKAGVKLGSNGLIEIDRETCATNVPGIYAVGDAVNGGTTAVQAIAEGMRAAKGI